MANRNIRRGARDRSRRVPRLGSDGVEKLQEGGADVVLMNMQYSPRTESIVAIGAYADGMRWVAREREVPVFDRLAIMRHWYDAGQFDLYTATKDMKMAKSVHDCLGRALGATDHRRGASGSAARGGAAMRAVPYFFRLATALSFAATAATVALVPARADNAAARQAPLSPAMRPLI